MDKFFEQVFDQFLNINRVIDKNVWKICVSNFWTRFGTKSCPNFWTEFSINIFTTVFDQILEQISGPKFKTKSQNQILDYILAKFQAIIFYHIWT